MVVVNQHNGTLIKSNTLV